MSLRDLLRRRPLGVAHVSSSIPLRERLRDALQTPPHPNKYVAPRLRTLDAVAFALRGYSVRWTPPGMFVTPDQPSPSVLVSLSRFPNGATVLVEVPTIIPGEVHRAASWLQGARVVGWRFALWQVRREWPWVRQRRGQR